MREAIGGYALKYFFEGLARAGSLVPSARRMRNGLLIEKDIAYGPLRPWHLLDVYKQDQQQRPALLYLHGGAFRILSKDTHWIMASMFARAGYVVFNANYRLSPKEKFPAAMEDAALAYEWVVQNGARYGADPSRIVVAGESAGANLSLTLALCASFERPEAFAKRVYATGVVPRAVAPVCGVLQVSDAARFIRKRPKLPAIVADRLSEMEIAYIGTQSDAHLADPLMLLESDAEPSRPIPPMYSAVGTKDVLLDDTRRLGKALEKRAVKNRIDIYPKELHAFHAFLWRPAARDCWENQLSFLRAALL
jgi:acetyl esterase